MPYADPIKKALYFRQRHEREKAELIRLGKTFRPKRQKAKSEIERISRRNEIARRSMKQRRAMVRDYERVRYAKNHRVRLAKCIRATMTRAFKRLATGQKSVKTHALLGCTMDELKQHIQSQFKLSMHWNNYGKWHVDHKLPLASFDLFDPVQQRKAFSYKNLQPLWAIENHKKGSRLL